MADRRVASLRHAGVGLVSISQLDAGFDWPGPNPRTHLVLATRAGEGELAVGTEWSTLDSGSIAVCPAGVARHHRAQRPWEVLSIRLRDVEPWSTFRAAGSVVLRGQEVDRLVTPVRGILSELPAAITRIEGETRGSAPMAVILDRYANRVPQPDMPGAGVRRSEPFAMYASILRLQLERLVTVGPRDDGGERVEHLWEQVRRDPGAAWSVPALAEALHVSRATLHRLVRRHTSESPGAMVERIRMEHAEHLLAHTDLPVKAIAKQVGYGSAYAFSSAFRRAVGESPSHRRSRARQSVSDD